MKFRAKDAEAVANLRTGAKRHGLHAQDAMGGERLLAQIAEGQEAHDSRIKKVDV